MPGPLKYVLIAALLIIAGCQFRNAFVSNKHTDPLTQYLRDQDFHAFHPPRSRAIVGELHRHETFSSKVAPIVQVSDVLDPEECQKLMLASRTDVTLPTVSSNRTYDLTAKSAVIGAFSGQLSAKGVRKYRVRVKNPREYVLSQARFRQVVEPVIREVLVGSTLDQKHYIHSLLEVDEVEYELLDKSGAVVNLELDESLKESITADLGGDWQVTRNGTLKSTEPRFIGYRTHQLQVTQIDGEEVSYPCSGDE